MLLDVDLVKTICLETYTKQFIKDSKVSKYYITDDGIVVKFENIGSTYIIPCYLYLKKMHEKQLCEK